MLPVIQRRACAAFASLPAEPREEAAQEATCLALAAFVRLVRRGRGHVATAGTLVKWAVLHVRAGRQMGTPANRHDVTSLCSQRVHGHRVERLDRHDPDDGSWLEAIAVDHRTSVPDQAAFRVDFPAWLATLPPRDRRLVVVLALGHSTTEAALAFGVTAARVSQKRREFAQQWERFHRPQGRCVLDRTVLDASRSCNGERVV
jgi:hypothetical protein